MTNIPSSQILTSVSAVPQNLSARMVDKVDSLVARDAVRKAFTSVTLSLLQPK
jgi:hypothetical protein